jgi:nascent polypeptide-associated complex subunit alpha
MFPGMNPRQMQQAMKRMGIQQTEIDATEVIIKCPGKEIVITNPQVSKVNMMGQQTFQVVGQISERSAETEPEISEDDIKTVAEQASVSEEEARIALEKAKGDLAKAILLLKEEE